MFGMEVALLFPMDDLPAKTFPQEIPAGRPLRVQKATNVVISEQRKTNLELVMKILCFWKKEL